MTLTKTHIHSIQQLDGVALLRLLLVEQSSNALPHQLDHDLPGCLPDINPSSFGLQGNLVVNFLADQRRGPQQCAFRG